MCEPVPSAPTLSAFAVVFNSSQEEDLQEIAAKISSKRTESEEAKTQLAKLKADYEKADQEYKLHKDSISTIAEEADSVKVILWLWYSLWNFWIRKPIVKKKLHVE